MEKTLVILDWDDTLFPTTAITDIDKNNLIKLDKIVFTFFKQLLSNPHIDVIIVTNAMRKWINQSKELLPQTSKLIDNRIKIYSARDLYKNRLPNHMHLWKTLVYNRVIKATAERYRNIISIGDAEYEMRALINLYMLKKSDRVKRRLKNIKFINSPSFDTLIDQVSVVSKNFHKICNHRDHLDLVFHNKKIE